MNATTDEATRRGRTLTRRWMLALALAVSAAAVLAGAASADQPSFLEQNHTYVREVPHAATCKPYGYTFTVSYHYDVVRTIKEFADNDGNVLREVIEAHFVGTATVYPLPAVPQPDVIPRIELFEAGPDVLESRYADFCAALADS